MNVDKEQLDAIEEDFQKWQTGHRARIVFFNLVTPIIGVLLFMFGSGREVWSVSILGMLFTAPVIGYLIFRFCFISPAYFFGYLLYPLRKMAGDANEFDGLYHIQIFDCPPKAPGGPPRYIPRKTPKPLKVWIGAFWILVPFGIIAGGLLFVATAGQQIKEDLRDPFTVPELITNVLIYGGCFGLFMFLFEALIWPRLTFHDWNEGERIVEDFKAQIKYQPGAKRSDKGQTDFQSQEAQD